MANKKSADGTSKQPTVQEIKDWYSLNKDKIEQFAKYKGDIYPIRDTTRPITKSVTAINKDALKTYIQNVGSNEKNLRSVARYLYYRSNIFFRIVQWYAGMWDLHARKITPPYNLVKGGDAKKMLKSYNDTLDVLDRLNIHDNMVEVFQNVYIQDVYYGIRYTDDVGTFFYMLDPDDCMIDSRYSTGDFGFAVDMSKWRSTQRQKIIEFLGSPLKEMYAEYERTNEKYVHMDDQYAVCFKFRTDMWDMVIPPLLPIYLSVAGLEDLVDIEAEADALSIYKLIYMPMPAHSGSKDVDDFVYSPDLQHQYFNRLLADGVLPDGVAAAMIPDEELKVIDFARTVDSNVNAVEVSQNQILSTAGGGAVINSNNITSTAAFNAWLESETQFALSSLIGQVNGAVNRWLSYEINNPAKVEFFEVSVYTKQKLAEQLLESCKYSFSNRLAYNSLIGISERETLAMEFFETEVLRLPELMQHPLSSSFTQTGEKGEVGQGAPTKDDDELTKSGENDRNR